MKNLKNISETRTCPETKNEVILTYQITVIDEEQIGPVQFKACNLMRECEFVKKGESSNLSDNCPRSRESK